ncbi:hypothetical protein HN706_01805 [Candidatus Woesearchaeota archaeon]|nr:hypothetical protein [Candidatus Woesearchaeota archaeon]MBT7474656.1 hypothetical protein [Candidatus Woesearchaeota archaeon]
MKFPIIIFSLMSLVFFTACSPSISSPQIIHCDEDSNEYFLKENLNTAIESDQQAFDTLKQYWNVYDSEEGSIHVSGGIRSDMTVEEALTGILRKNINIQTNNGLVENVWMLYNLKAVDNSGKIYFCELINSDDSVGQFCDETGCVPLEQSKTPE